MSIFNPVWHLRKGKEATDNLRRRPEDDVKDSVEMRHVHDSQILNLHEEQAETKSCDSQQEILWLNVIFITLFHVVALYAFIFELQNAKIVTILWAIFIGGVGGFGITAGVHRLWAHRSYKAKLPLQIILLFCYTVAGQNDVREWVRDHRVHHKFSETDADPHNSNRGLFFAHVGWLMQKKHPDVRRKGKTVDLSDILNDPLITFHTRYFLYLKLLLCFIIPTVIPVYCWNECWKIAILSQVFARYVTSLNFTWSVNSIAHTWGKKPYNKRIKPTENMAVAVVAMGEGFHNYHHVFPWDYKAAELGNYSLNVTALWLDIFAKIGWAYDLRSPSKELIERVIKNRGDKSVDIKDY